MRLTVSSDGNIAAHSDCTGGTGGGGGSSSSSSSWTPSLSDAVSRVSCAGAGQGYIETHGGACFRFRVTAADPDASSAAGSAAGAAAAASGGAVQVHPGLTLLGFNA